MSINKNKGVDVVTNYLHAIHATKAEPTDVLEMILIEDNPVHNNDASEPHVDPPKQHESGKLNIYIYHDNGKGVVTEFEKPENVCD